MRIGIIGAGHAGVEAARAARDAGAEVVVFSAEDTAPYFRPRLVALAFGQIELSGMVFHPPAWYAAQGIALRLGTPVDALEPAALALHANGGVERFDAVVLAAGAEPVVPFGPGLPAGVVPLWNATHAAAIRARVRPGAHLVVVGGGILGLEAALRAREAGMTVRLLELQERLMPAQFGPSASHVLLRLLAAKGVEVSLRSRVTRLAPGSDGVGVLVERDGEHVEECACCLVAVGARPLKGLGERAGLAVERGVKVDDALQTSVPRVFGAGDVNQLRGVLRCSAREAQAQGRVAGANAVAAVRGEPLRMYQPELQPLTLKVRDFEMHAAGDAGSEGTTEQPLEASTETRCRVLVLKDGLVAGVQMVGTREGFDDYLDLVRQRGR
jgi:NAD(P)H-nitrite reductase large subunit